MSSFMDVFVTSFIYLLSILTGLVLHKGMQEMLTLESECRIISFSYKKRKLRSPRTTGLSKGEVSKKQQIHSNQEKQNPAKQLV